MLPIKLNIYVEYHGYFSLVVAGIILIYVKNDNRYEKVLQDCENLSPNKKRIFFYVSTAYILILVVAFFWSGYLIRAYNLGR